MAESLVIVESPSKAKTITQYLGDGFEVLATVGHVKDLPVKKLGVDVENNFQAEYGVIRGKDKVVKELKKAATKAKTIYIATDPDREGEAIAWHIQETIVTPRSKKLVQRVLFNEITKAGVKDGIANPLPLNDNLYQAQQARRIMDRLVGYQVSPFLWKTVCRGLSAGRVQSVALRLVCEREDAIRKFKPVEYWTLPARVQGDDTDVFDARLEQYEGKSLARGAVEKSDKQFAIASEADAKDHAGAIEKSALIISEIKKREVKRKPDAPFTTSTLQQEAARRLGWTAKRIMMIAQQLYEGVELGKKDGAVGLITYMRTDSTRLADTSVSEARDYIFNTYGDDYLPAKPVVYASKKKRVQDAHEAIRPTSVIRSPLAVAKHLTKEQKALYELIWRRMVACQMANAKVDQTTVNIDAGDRQLRATGSIIKFRGFLQVFEDFTEEGADTNAGEDVVGALLPDNLKKGMALTLRSIDPKQHFTKPPARYSESTLVKELDNLGIGRPSTYASIISNITDRKYVDKEQRRLIPTELGESVNKILIESFPDIFNVKFTSHMEDEFDEIESGEKNMPNVLQEFYTPFLADLETLSENVAKIKEKMVEKTDEVCEKCGSPMIIRWSRRGKFLGCSGYPNCKNTRPLDGEAPKELNESCPDCKSPLIEKEGRFGKFIACSDYPKCKYTRPFTLGIPCPKDGCKGELVQRRTKRGKPFYGCSKYPDCDFASWYKIVMDACPECGHAFLEERSSDKRGTYLRCPECKKTQDTAEPTT